MTHSVAARLQFSVFRYWACALRMLTNGRERNAWLKRNRAIQQLMQVDGVP